MITLVCKQCGKNFDVFPGRIKKDPKFCSRACYNKAKSGSGNPNWKGGKIKRVCKECGAVFWVHPNQLKDGAYYCSRACQTESQRGKVTCLCEWCGKEFLIKPSEIKRGGGKHCSRECYDKRLNEDRLKGKCAQCGKDIYLTPFQLKHHEKAFCSRKCNHEFNRGPNHVFWRGGVSFEPYCEKFDFGLREQIRDAFGRKCFLCGKSENGRRLSVHHIDYNKVQGCNGKRWALIPLCGSCHTRTNNQRHYYFNLLINYWAMNPETNIYEINGIVA